MIHSYLRLRKDKGFKYSMQIFFYNNKIFDLLFPPNGVLCDKSLP